MNRFLFPTWTNRLVHLLLGVGTVGVLYVLAVGAYGTSPQTVNVGYSPKQPLPFSHRLHAGQLKMDCRYCHYTVEQAAHAAVPPTEICAKCHSGAGSDGVAATVSVHPQSQMLLAVRESQATGEPIEWERIHDLPDFAYFDHSAHVNRGVGCVSCHGRVDKMEQVYQAKPLSMSWCLDCHRNPDPNLRPLDKITDMEWRPVDPEQQGALLREQLDIHPSTNCSTCHR